MALAAAAAERAESCVCAGQAAWQYVGEARVNMVGCVPLGSNRQKKIQGQLVQPGMVGGSDHLGMLCKAV